MVAGFNVCGVTITKYASAAQRSSIDSCRTLMIWLVFILLGKEKFMAGELFGFALLVYGTLVYNEIIEMPFEFLNRSTEAGQARQKAKGSENESRLIE
jgi:hypothetical protein